MANQLQIAILKRRVELWNWWREGSPNAKIDLSQADLRGANLEGANFKEAYIVKANLCEANLIRANFMKADLRGALLCIADLRGADLRGADLREADLLLADLREANLSGADLDGANLEQVKFGRTILKNINLSNAEKLEEVVHHGSSTIDTKTLQRSKGKIPKEFLRGCGLINLDIEYAKLYQEGLSAKEEGYILARICALRGNLNLAKLEYDRGTKSINEMRSEHKKYQARISDKDSIFRTSLLLRKAVSNQEKNNEETLEFVHFAVTSSPKVIAGANFLLDFWVHLENQREEVIRRAKEALATKKIQIRPEGPVKLKRGTDLTVEVDIDGMAIEPPHKIISWSGDISTYFPLPLGRGLELRAG